LSAKNLLIGVGNVLFKDEGVGVYAAKYLENNYSFDDSLEIIDGGVLGFKLMALFQEYDNVIILDTVSIEDSPGSVYRLPSDVLMGLGSYRKTAHEVEIIEMLEICSMLEKMANVVIIGIVPLDIGVENALTDELISAMPQYLRTVLDELDTLGVKYEKKNNITIESVIDNFFKENSVGNQI
jgi:hydrogenase maturation protease